MKNNNEQNDSITKEFQYGEQTMSSSVSEKVRSNLKPFGIQIDTPRNCDVLLQCVPGCRLRGAVSASKPVIDQRTGDEMIPQDQSRHLGQLPKIPGMEIHVNPDKCTYTIIDPLHDNEELCNRIQKYMNVSSVFRTDGKLSGIPPKIGTLDVHRMKSLCRELLWLIEADEAKVVKGIKPSMEEVEGMAGNFLLNPGSQIPNGQPLFENQFDEWVANLSKTGG